MQFEIDTGKNCRNFSSKEVYGIKFPSKNASSHVLYNVWHDMNRRCIDPKRKDYKHYGGRGIEVCQEWARGNKRGFHNFIRDMEPTFEKGLELERLDVNSGYCLENCTWTCRKSQVNNLRTNRILSGFGISLTVSEWAYFLKFNSGLLDDRINHLNHSKPLEEILSDTFKDRSYSLLYKGDILSARDIFEAEGFTLGQRNGRIVKYGGSINALIAEGIDFKIVQPREKNYLTFDDALASLRKTQVDIFETHLLEKIEKQLRGEL